MTKLEFIREIENNYKNGISVERSLDAVDRYSTAIIEQSKCSTLRDSIVQKMKEVAEAPPVHNDEFTEYERNLELEHLRIALSVIDELQPVA